MNDIYIFMVIAFMLLFHSHSIAMSDAPCPMRPQARMALRHLTRCPLGSWAGIEKLRFE